MNLSGEGDRRAAGSARTWLPRPRRPLPLDVMLWVVVPYVAIAVFIGGLLIPKSWTARSGISETAYHATASASWQAPAP